MVEARTRLAGILRRSGILPSVDSVTDGPPKVRHLNEGARRHGFNAIFVGSISQIVDISPFSLPLPSSSFNDNVNFMRSRADLQSFLYHLQGKVLVCDCAEGRESCWAWFLLRLFREVFIDNANETDDTDSEDEFTSEDEEILDAAVQSRLMRHADLVAGGRQGSRKRPGQLIEDGLTPEAHITKALALSHPFLGDGASTEAVKTALAGPEWEANEMILWREEVCQALTSLSREVKSDDAEMYDKMNPLVRTVLEAYLKKNISFMRELNFVINPVDFAAISCLVVGLPMIGWTFPAFGLMERLKPQTNSYEDWKADCASRNSLVVAAIQESGDPELDSKAFQKTLDEVEAKVLVGPFYSLEDIPCPNPGIAPRCGIWECHGEAELPEVRNIDNLLLGEQNSTTGSTHSHRPTDVDGLAAQCRAVSRARPGAKLAGWASDFAKAYKQVPGDPTQIEDVVLGQFDPWRRAVAFFIALSQVFGSSTAPVNFSRYPAWFCAVVAVVFLLPATHCVDDVIIIEELNIADSGKVCWDHLMALCGWKMSSSKDKWPAQIFTVIGISLDLRPLPNGDPSILVTKRRIESLRSLIRTILASGIIGSGQASSLSGKLGFTLSAAFGRSGRCRIKPILKRAYSRVGPLGKVLVNCLLWWLAFLTEYVPRPVPTSLESLPCVVSYSDGEGGSAGIGAALWHPHHPRPLAAYAKVPVMIREQWRVIQSSVGFEDIFLVEALGPLLLLTAFPKILSQCLWIHFIDNSAAEASLIRGASSSDLGDHVVGLTWSLIQKRLLWTYFDRVGTKANPVDGLSRRRFGGPWEWVRQIPFPVEHLVDFALSLESNLHT